MGETVKSLCGGIPKSIAKLLRDILLAKYLPSYGIIHIVMYIRDLVGKSDDLPFKCGGIALCLVI